MMDFDYRKLLSEYYEYLGSEKPAKRSYVDLQLICFADWLNGSGVEKMKEEINTAYAKDTQDLLELLVMRCKKIVKSDKIPDNVKYDFRRLLRILESI
jgi:hypothetical protein